MTTPLDSATLSLLEEHVRQLLTTMGFAAVTVQARQHVPVATPKADNEEEALLGNAALNTYQAPTRSRPTQTYSELLLSIEAGDDGKLLIGAQGSHLEALQHILRMILRRQLGQAIHVMVDVNNYRAHREESLVHMALNAARRARTSGRIVTLSPMNAADRRVLHTALAEHTDVRTESIGGEPNRRVIIRPVF